MAEVVVYTTMFCPFCTGARKLLRSHGVAFEEIDVTMNAARRASMARMAGGRRTVPQIFIDGEAIGGYDDLVRLERSGGLAARLGARA
ncbi:MAG: glutaredoxin 3 [Alphaproteobacteria bacterium]|nr:glutaredoxin 3 [Alphaproteobacteria bacterium]MCY4607612.1 glutaredoxin 3 [bacterium]